MPMPIEIWRSAKKGEYLVYAESYDVPARTVYLHTYTVAATPELDAAFAARDKLAILEALRNLPMKEIRVMRFRMGRGHTPRTFLDRASDGSSPESHVTLW